MAKKAYEPTEKDRAVVVNMARAGFSQADIGLALGISEDTVNKYYRKELDTTEKLSIAQATSWLWKAMKEGNLTAIIFYLKTRGKWRETDRLELTAADGANLIPVININVKKA